jgi:class 3 adenylate cyclase
VLRANPQLSRVSYGDRDDRFVRAWSDGSEQLYLNRHSGAVVAGNIGSQDRMKYGVVGPTVNLTGRTESLTIGPQILLSEATLGRVRHVVSVGPGVQVAVRACRSP